MPSRHVFVRVNNVSGLWSVSLLPLTYFDWLNLFFDNLEGTNHKADDISTTTTMLTSQSDFLSDSSYLAAFQKNFSKFRIILFDKSENLMV